MGARSSAGRYLGGTGEAEALVKVALKNFIIAELKDAPPGDNRIARYWEKFNGSHGYLEDAHADPWQRQCKRPVMQADAKGCNKHRRWMTRIDAAA